jgi:hypothetical protein
MDLSFRFVLLEEERMMCGLSLMALWNRCNNTPFDAIGSQDISSTTRIRRKWRLKKACCWQGKCA